MATLRGGTTIAGYPALHSGLKEALLLNNLTVKNDLTVDGHLNVGKNIYLGTGTGIYSARNNNYIINDHNNGNITLSAAGNNLLLGHQNTSNVQLSSNMTTGGGTVIDTSGRLYYQGNNTDSRYVRSASDSYVYGDTNGSSAYPRIVFGNSGASSPQYFRANSTTGGFLPYSNGNSYVGTNSWQFQEMHAVNFYENGATLSSKYSSSSHNHDSRYVSRSGDTVTGNMTINGDLTLDSNLTTEGITINQSSFRAYLTFENPTRTNWEVALPSGNISLGTGSQGTVANRSFEFTDSNDFRVRNGNILANNRILVDDRIVLNNTNSNYQLQWGNSASLGRNNSSGWDWVGHINSAIRFHDGDALIESNTHFNVDGILTVRGERVPRIFHGTSTPSGSGWNTGDIWIQY